MIPYIATALSIGLLVISNGASRPLVGLLAASSLYYCCLGALYWSGHQGGYFIGVYWGRGEITFALNILAWSILLSQVMIQLMLGPCSAAVAGLRRQDNQSNRARSQALLFSVVLTLALLGTAYTAQSAIRNSAIDRADPILLIAYQFSDLLIPVTLLLLGREQFRSLGALFLTIFIAYSILLGSRYKIVLVITPLLFSYLMGDLTRERRSTRLAKSLFVGACVILFLGIFTILRDKFSGVDMSRISDATTERLLYGLMAESNIVFGLLSIINDFVYQDRYLGMLPVWVAIEDWLPRALFPNKGGDSYMTAVLAGLLSNEALGSATAYPYIGEYLLMGGYAGLAVGIVLYSLCSATCVALLSVNSCDGASRSIGLGLIAVFFGYYYLSRGYLPQAMKGFSFILLPYLFLHHKLRS